VLVILKQRIDTNSVETDIHIQEDVIGMLTDDDCVSQEWEPVVSHILRVSVC